MSKTYEALRELERQRAAQQPATARMLARAAEERETLQEEVRACQERLAALAKRIEATPVVDPAAVDELRRQVAQLATRQERLAVQPRQLLDEALRRTGEETERRLAPLQSVVDEIRSLTLRLDAIQDGVVPAIEGARADIDELRRLGADRQRSEQAELQTTAAALDHIRDQTARVMRRVDEQQGELRRVLEDLAAVRDAQPDRARQEKALALLSGALEATSARLNDLEASRQGDRQPVAEALRHLQEEAGRLHGEVQRSQEEVDRLRATVLESDAALAAAIPSQVGALRGELNALCEQLAAADAEQREFRQRWEEQRAEEQRRLSSSLAETLRVVQGSVDEARGTQRGFAERLAVIEESRLESDRRLREAFDGLQSALVEQQQRAGEIEALRGQLTPLAAVQGRQQQLADGMERAREVADEALRRVEEIGQAHASNMERLQQQIAALRGERETLRDGLAAVQASVSGQLDSAAEIEELRAQLAPLADVQARQQELVDVVGRVAAAADDAAGRIVATEAAQQAAVEAVRQQLAAAQADRDNLRGVLATIQSDLARAIGSDGELGALWQSVAPLVEAHARRQEFVSALSRAQDAAADALRRVAAIEKGQAGGLVDLERGIAELQTDRVKLDEAIERRFELLCGIIDAELEARIAPLEARITELRADEGADSGDAARQAPDDSLIGRVSSMALTRRKAHSRYKRGN